MRRLLWSVSAITIVLGMAAVEVFVVDADAGSGRPAVPAAVPGSSTTAAPTPTRPPAPTTTVVPTPPDDGLTADQRRLEHVESIAGDISPKSVVHSGAGLFFAQNMMYRHTITVYDRSFDLVATIPDAVDLGALGVPGYEGSFQGAPVEVAFTSDGRHAYVSNYEMYGPGFDRPGGDGCDPGEWDDSFVYRVDTERLEIDQAIPVGAVPKYVAVTPDDATVLVTNWCTYDLSVIDAASATEVARVPIGRFPRGIAVDAGSRRAYVAVMGGSEIAVVDLVDHSVQRVGVGANPRHVVIGPEGRYLYVTLNQSGEVVKLDLTTSEIVGRVATGAGARSMEISDDGAALYVVNYHDGTLSKVATGDMTEVQELPAHHHPIGVTYDPATRQVWVANYSGVIDVYTDR